MLPRDDAIAARSACAKPVPLSRAAGDGDAGERDDVPAPNWAGDVRGVWVPQDGCYLVPLRCGGAWVGARVDAADHARGELAGCTLLLRNAIAAGGGGATKRGVGGDASAAAAAAAAADEDAVPRKKRRIRKLGSVEAERERRREEETQRT